MGELALLSLYASGQFTDRTSSLGLVRPNTKSILQNQKHTQGPGSLSTLKLESIINNILPTSAGLQVRKTNS